MGEEFHAIIKLVSGEEIFSFVTVEEDSDDPILVLQNPVIFKILNNGQGNFIKVKPWMELSCLLYTSPSPRDRTRSRMPSSA